MTRLSELGVEPRLAPEHGASHDQVQLQWSSGLGDWRLAIKPQLRLSTIAHALHNLTSRQEGAPTLLVTSAMTDSMAKRAREAGVNYVDTAGNSWLTAEGLLIDVRGRRVEEPRRPAGVGISKTSLRVVLTILALPDMVDAPLREIASVSRTSLGTAQQAMKELSRKGHVTKGGIRHGARLLETWTSAYLAHGGMHRISRDYSVDPGLDLSDVIGDQGSLSGDTAANARGWGLRPTSAIVYTDDPSRVLTALRARQPATPGTPLNVRSPGIDTSLVGIAHTAPAAIIRADLLLGGDPRQVEIAEEALQHDESLRSLR